ncbi:MAG: hypothetical protein V4819_24055 [Verrucomicrobiota bacterium]
MPLYVVAPPPDQTTIRFLTPGKEKRDLLRMKGLFNGGNRQLKPLWQGFFRRYHEGNGGELHKGLIRWSRAKLNDPDPGRYREGIGGEICEALIHWSRAKLNDPDLDRALGWRPSVKKERIGQVAELRRVAEFNGISNYNNFVMLDPRYLEAGTSNLAEFWKKNYSVDLLWIVCRVLSSSGVNGEDLKRLGWKPLCEGKADHSIAVGQGGLWAKEMVPNAKKILRTPPKTLPAQEKSPVNLPGWVVSLKPKDFIELRRTILTGVVVKEPEGDRPTKVPHFARGSMVAFIWLSYRCGQFCAAWESRWLEALDAPSQRALGFSKTGKHGRPMLPSWKDINNFVVMMTNERWDTSIIDARLGEWLKKRGIAVGRAW